MATIVNTKLGEHRGKKRVWLEGKSYCVKVTILA